MNVRKAGGRRGTFIEQSLGSIPAHRTDRTTDTHNLTGHDTATTYSQRCILILSSTLHPYHNCLQPFNEVLLNFLVLEGVTLRPLGCSDRGFESSRSLAGVADSNPAGGTDVCVMSCVVSKDEQAKCRKRNTN